MIYGMPYSVLALYLISSSYSVVLYFSASSRLLDLSSAGYLHGYLLDHSTLSDSLCTAIHVESAVTSRSTTLDMEGRPWRLGLVDGILTANSLSRRAASIALARVMMLNVVSAITNLDNKGLAKAISNVMLLYWCTGMTTHLPAVIWKLLRSLRSRTKMTASMESHKSKYGSNHTFAIYKLIISFHKDVYLSETVELHLSPCHCCHRAGDDYVRGGRLAGCYRRCRNPRDILAKKHDRNIEPEIFDLSLHTR